MAAARERGGRRPTTQHWLPPRLGLSRGFPRRAPPLPGTPPRGGTSVPSPAPPCRGPALCPAGCPELGTWTLSSLLSRSSASLIHFTFCQKLLKAM